MLGDGPYDTAVTPVQNQAQVLETAQTRTWLRFAPHNVDELSPSGVPAFSEGVCMLKALERNVAGVDERIVLVAPAASSVSDFFRNVDVDASRHTELLHDVQRFRGQIYLQDGAIHEHQLTADGRHETPEDERAWHVVLMNGQRKISACALYLEHENTVAIDDLRVRHSPLAAQEEWKPKLWKAIHTELARARRENLRYVELGGWAVAPEARRTSGPLTMALGVYGFSRRFGGALGMTTATFRHCSAVILQRLGGSRFEVDGTTLPPYYDPRYKCMMEMLRFDSREPNPKYVDLIDRLRDRLANALVITRPVASGLSEMFTAPAIGRSSPQPLFAA